jgi:hypothetical protein
MLRMENAVGGLDRHKMRVLARLLSVTAVT